MTVSQGSRAYKILVVEDDNNERSGLQRLLADAGYQVCSVDSADKAISYFDDAIDFVLTDLRMGDVSGMDLLKHWKLKQPETMFLVITGNGSTQTAIDAIRAGAYDYMTKPLDINKLLVTLQNMVRQREESRKVLELQNRLDEKFSLSSIIGRSPQMQRVFELIRRSAQAFSTVLILGESGTGKELVAQAIHQNSPRRDGPFVAVNCAAMPATLVESELFGHERGAFTGADQRRMGRFEQAIGGTLFIDEIGEFEVALQVKLLRVMENRVITPVGGNKDIKVDTRVLAATSRDIREMMAKGQFREDLYYRLNVITIELPPLRQRLDDIPLLVKRFMDRVNDQNGTRITSIAPNVIDALQQYHWPGNVRELLNIIERMMVLADKPALEMDELPAYIRNPANRTVVAAAAPSTAASSTSSGPGATPQPATAPDPSLDLALATMTLADLEDRAIAAALVRFNNNRTRAARALGISVRTLQRKLGAKNAPEIPEPDATAPNAGEPVEEPANTHHSNSAAPIHLVGSSIA
ncbi:MAG TPA: sigma-54 dependent transcriptional regulator [Phycisphaerae bacterium]|nr:sigma-54 dependent transcriptional regulator [Phycisphaerae bacterium]